MSKRTAKSIKSGKTAAKSSTQSKTEPKPLPLLQNQEKWAKIPLNHAQNRYFSCFAAFRAFFESKVANKPIYSPLEANASEKSAYDKGEKLSKARAKKGEKAREKEW